MKKEQYEELSGRIDGIGHFVLALSATLEMNITIDGKTLTDRVRQSAGGRTVPGRPVCSAAIQRTMLDLADELDRMRDFRLSKLN